MKVCKLNFNLEISPPQQPLNTYFNKLTLKGLQGSVIYLNLGPIWSNTSEFGWQGAQQYVLACNCGTNLIDSGNRLRLCSIQKKWEWERFYPIF